MAVSGGVDSSLAAYLLKEQGFKVNLIFGLFLDPEQEPFVLQQIERVKKLSAKIKAPFQIIDKRAEFKKEVVNYFLKTYSKGQTPNPCVICNEKIKFNMLLEKAGSNCYLATGHYARIKKIGKNYFIFRGKDSLKDQSYFLWRLPSRILSRLIFPLGCFLKKQVKRIAQEQGLVQEKISESKDICFATNIPQFLLKNLSYLAKKGEILDELGRVIGEHQGIIFYTIGQRYGLKIDKTKMNQPENLPPLYVKRIIPLKNQLIVAKRAKLMEKNIKISQTNFFTKVPFIFKALVQIRYGHKAKTAKIYFKKRQTQVIFDKPVFAPTPGQSAVIYQKSQLLGGGVISSI